MSSPHDPLPLARALIRCASVTPNEAGALETLESALEPLGFVCERFDFGDVANLYARRGRSGRNFCFAGHLDVVPPGDAARWSVPPFAAEIRDGVLFGRGAVDMKGAIAAMVASCARQIDAAPDFDGSLSFLITLDEEGPALDGTKRVLAALAERGETLDHCLVGEPTSGAALADTIKNGRRGSLNALVTARGKQGHVAYPKLAANPVSTLLDFLQRLRNEMLDTGAPGFDASNLEVTSVDVGNPTHNVIPAEARARFNIRFNTRHSGATLTEWIERARARTLMVHRQVDLELAIAVTGESFFTEEGPFTTFALDAAESVTGRRPVLSTSGGTSDARFIKDHCPVIELGLRNATAHQIDEHVAIEDVRGLADIYTALLARYFA